MQLHSIEGLGAEISPEPISGFPRVGIHESFVILSDLNMVQQVRVRTLTPDGEMSILEKIDSEEGLTPGQRDAALKRYADQIITKSTNGAFIDTATGNFVDAESETTVEQRAIFQNITLGDLEDMGLQIGRDQKFSVLLYALLSKEIQNINSRGDL